MFACGDEIISCNRDKRSLSREAPIYSQSLKVICLQPTDSRIFKSRKQSLSLKSTKSAGNAEYLSRRFAWKSGK